MTRANFIKKVAKDSDLTIRDATVAVGAVFDNLRKLLLDGDTFALQRFLTFKQVARAGRAGRNPSTGEEIWIKPSKSIRLVLSPIFKAELNNQLPQ